jgi:cell division protein FtsB
MKILNAGLLLLLLVVQYRLWFAAGGIPEVWKTYQTKQAQLQENTRLQERNAALSADVADLKDGMEAIEERARSEMGMIKQGEKFYQIIEAPSVQGK